ncbi:MAG TPA: site-specific integrase [Pirellulales bacterium]|nr:site-specific integrase [Pirellulales bacterium]
MRQPKPFFRKQTQSWYVQIGKRQHNLGRDEKEAWAKYHELMSSTPAPADETTLIGDLLGRFLEWTKLHRKPATFTWYAEYVNSFGQFVGSRPAAEIKPHHVTRWLDFHGWKDTTRCCAIRAIKRAFNWAVEEGYLDASPVRKVKRGKPKRRETIISAEQWQAILAEVPDTAFRDLLTFARETGARPQEARAIEARHLDLAAGLILLPANEAKGERPRPIYLNDAALPLVARLAEEHPTGPLFQNTRGKRWTKNAVTLRWRRLRRKIGIEGATMYALRHSFATDALMNGVDSIVVAELMGHADQTMVARTYQHLAKNPEFLRRAANAARQSGTN